MSDHMNMQHRPRKHSSQKILLILAGITLLSTFLPWFHMNIPELGGIPLGIPDVSVNGMHSVGMLTFLGSLGYVLWKGLPMAGISIPQISMSDIKLQKTLAILMIAGPIFWILKMQFGLSGTGIGFWGALICSTLFAWKTFKK